MATKIWIREINIGLKIKDKRHYRLFSVDFKQNKMPISPIFKGRDYFHHIPKEREKGMKYEIQRVKYKPGTHIVRE